MKKQKLFKKVLSLLMVAVLLTVSTGCSKKETNVKESSTAKKNEEKEKEKEKDLYKDVKIGVINIGTSKDTAGYTFAHINGIKGMMSSLGLKDNQIMYKDEVPDGVADLSTIKMAIQECVDAKCNIIFGTSYGFKQAMAEYAELYPEITFSHCSGELYNGKNFNRYFGKIYQPFYLAGIAAGLKTQTNKIGFVSAWGKTISESAYCLNAFAMGVASVNKTAKVYSYKINSWSNKDLETTAATYLVKNKADVIAQDTDTSAPQIIAQKNNVWSIGYNSDMSKDAPKATLLSVVWNWSAYYTYAVKEIVSGTWKAPNYFGGMKEGLVGITDLADFNAEGADKQIQEVTKKFTDGSWDVFEGVIPTNTKTTVGTAGKAIDDDTLQFKTDWLYQNIVEVGPNK